MLLKSLELQGFKTFPDKTKMTFEDGISAVVGPNGSGKSNISDAMRWVLGEQSAKSLRCVKMEDVIFGGAVGRKPQGFAEVTLTIDNTERLLPYDGDTVAITRRYYRSGESEYLINKAAVRLRDIHELFMDTGLGRDGYSMIGQGKIDSIISAKSEERREIFEEASGISRYRYRKEESERKLQKTEENLVRLRDIVGELEGRVEPLREQAEKAKTYLALYQEKRKLEIGLWLYALQQSGEILRVQEEKLTIAQSQHDEAQAASEALDQQMEQLFLQTNACLAQAEALRSAAAQAEGDAIAKDGAADLLENDCFHNRETMARLQEEQSQFRESQMQQQAVLTEKQMQQEAIRQKREAVQTAYAQAQQELVSMQAQLQVSAEQIELANAQLKQLTEESAAGTLAATQASTMMEEIALRSGAIDEQLQEKQRQQSSLSARCAEQKASLQTAEEAEQQHKAQLSKAEEALRLHAAENDRLKGQRDQSYLDLQETMRRVKILEDLERSMEGFAHSVKTVMRCSEKKELYGIHGPVTRLIAVPQKYAVAIETALGSSAQHIVVSTEADAKAAIRLLQKRDGGRATFLPLTTIRGKTLHEPSLSRCAGFLGIAGQLCRCEGQYQQVLDSLLGRIAVVDTLDHAVEIAKQFRYAFRIVTLDGQVVNAGGSMTGGSLARKNGLLSRAAEIASLQETVEQLRLLHQKQKQAFLEKTQELQALQAQLQQMRNDLSVLSEQRLEITQQYHRIASEYSAVSLQSEELQAEQTRLQQRRAELQTTQNKAQAQLAQLEQEILQVQAQLGKLSGGRTEQQQAMEVLTRHLQELRLQLMTLDKDAELLETVMAELLQKLEEGAARAAQMERQIADCEEKQKALVLEIEKTKAEAQALREQAAEQKQAAEQCQTTRLQLEQQTVALRAKEKEISAVRERLGQELTRLEERKQTLQQRCDGIIEQLWTEYELTRREAEQETAPVAEEDTAARELRALKARMKALGSVNVDAIAEYETVYERYQFLTAQVEDVEISRKQLQEIIRELTTQMTEIFKTRFAQIDRHFQSTFQELFGGGKAHLELEEPEAVLHSGIRILAQPPGKVVKNLELLSGGEKALVAICLYFAIMKVTPPPFCMLDEIEAALDDVNVTRFAEYLRRMNRNTQFIVITHRRGTMEEADVLYGVTMQEEGVSKLLKLDPSEVGRELGI